MLNELVEPMLQKQPKRKANHKIQVRSNIQIDNAFDRTAFGILGATAGDNYQHIIELAEKQSQVLNNNICTKARLNLTNSRNRLSAEIAWLPGLPTKRVNAYLILLKHDIDFYLSSSSHESPLIKANLISAAMEFFGPETSDDDWTSWIYELSCQAIQINPEAVYKIINDDRSISGFPRILDLRHVESKIRERRQYFKKVIKDAINQLSTTRILNVISNVVKIATVSKNQYAQILLNEIIGTFGTEVRLFLDQETRNVLKLITRVHEAATGGDKKIKPILDKLEIVVRYWDKIANPIRFSMKAQSMEHEQSRKLIFEIRNLGTELFKKKGMFTQVQHITSLIQRVYADLPEAVNLSIKDQKQSECGQQMFFRQANWKTKTTHQIEAGLILQSNLSISPNRISWKKIHYPLNTITHVRWGGVHLPVNGSSAVTTYTVAFGNNNLETDIELYSEKVYFTFIEKLWQTVGVRLLIELLKTFKSGQEVRFGEAVIRDDGVTILKHGLFVNKPVSFSWEQVHVWTTNGIFHIGAINDKNTSAGILYIHTPNANILEYAIRMAFKKQGIHRLSEILNDVSLSCQEIN